LTLAVEIESQANARGMSISSACRDILIAYVTKRHEEQRILSELKSTESKIIQEIRSLIQE